MGKRLVISFLVAVLALVLSLSLPAVPTSANPGIGLTPFESIKANVVPGETITHKLRLHLGEQDQAMDILVDVMGFGNSPDGLIKAVEAPKDTSPYSARSFITIDNPSFHLEPGESQDFIATIHVPGDVDTGSRYAIIHIHQSQPTGAGQVGTLAAFNIPVILTIKDSQLTHEGKITEVGSSEAVSGQPVDIVTTFQNTGNHHFKIKGEVTISNSQGKILDTIHIPLTTSSVIPTMSRQLKVTFIPQGELPLGVYSVKSKVMLEDDTILDEATGSFEVKEPYVPPPPPACVTLTPGSAATLETGDGRISISFPKGSVTSQVEVCLRNYPLEQLPSPPNGFELATTCFRVDGLSGLLAKDATLTVNYSDADLGRAGGDASRLRLARWGEANNEWSVLKTEVDSQAMTLNTITNQLSIWAVMVATAGTPPAAAPTEVNWVVIGGVVAGIIIIALLVYLLAVRRRRGY